VLFLLLLLRKDEEQIENKENEKNRYKTHEERRTSLSPLRIVAECEE
jgi:hypothetical protein